MFFCRPDHATPPYSFNEESSLQFDIYLNRSGIAMIIGKGLIASAFSKYILREDVVIFASGVSNSLEQNYHNFFREEKLLKESLHKYKNSLFVYFGTCSVYDKSLVNTYYIHHKCKMEKIVSEYGSKYIIFRLTQVVGKSNNKSTLLNYLYYNISAGRTFDLWSNAIRYIVDIDDVVRFVSFVIDDAKRYDLVVNLPTLPSKILYIVMSLEIIIGRRANYNLINKGMFYSIPILDPELTSLRAGIIIDENYLDSVLIKYYKGVNC